MEQHDALRKAQGLLNMAAESGIADNVRDAYQDKAFDLVEKYGIDQALLNAKAEHKQKPTRMVFDIIGQQAKYRVFALTQIASALHCRAVHQNFGGSYTRNSRRVIAFGFESDLAILEMLWASLQLQGFREVADIKGEITYVFGDWGEVKKKVSTKAMRNSFWQGFGYKIAQRIIAAEKRQNLEPSTELVLYDRSKEVDEAVDEAFPKLSEPDRFEIAHKAGFHAGMEAGERANLHDKAEVKNVQRELSS